MGKVVASDLRVKVPGAIYDMGSQPPKPRVVVPTPLAEWAFSEASAPFYSTSADLPLVQGHGSSFVTRSASPWGWSASISSPAFLKIDAASIGRLNIGAAGGTKVSLAAWVYLTDADIGFIGGCWQEDDTSPKRQYALFSDLPTYGGNERVCMHVSKTGGPSPGLPYSRDYASSNETFTRNAWMFFAGTYDGAQAVAYLNGKGTSYKNYTEPGPPNGQSLTYDKNPYLFDLGLNSTPCDFTVGACRLTAGMSNFMGGQVAKLRVWDTCLTPQEVQALYNAEVTAI